MVKPFLRWAGSKRKMLPKLLNYVNIPFNNYYEPFMGSASLFFALNIKKGILSDINEDLVKTFIQVKINPKKVFDILNKYNNTKENYYKLRAQIPKQLNDIERAARFIILNRFCFNGIYRTNTKGEFNVPYSNNKTGKLPTLNQLEIVSYKLKNIQILHSDFETVIKQNVTTNDLIYFDPPYAVSNRRIFGQYDVRIFGKEDLDRLSELLNFINSKKAHFILSYAYCKEAIVAFEKWHKSKSFVLRNIAGFAEHRRKAAELIITNIS